MLSRALEQIQQILPPLICSCLTIKEATWHVVTSHFSVSSAYSYETQLMKHKILMGKHTEETTSSLHTSAWVPFLVVIKEKCKRLSAVHLCASSVKASALLFEGVSKPRLCYLKEYQSLRYVAQCAFMQG